MKKRAVYICLLLALPLLCSGQGVQWREEIITLPTYLTGPEDPSPPLWNERVYPYSLQTDVSRTVADRPYRVIVLENEYIQVLILPEIGGRILAALDKTNDNFDFIYYNHVVKPGLVALRGAWLSGGIEWNFPTLGHTVNTFSPVNHTLIQHKDGSVSCVVGTEEWVRRMQWTVFITLEPGRSFFKTKIRLFNRTRTHNQAYFWANAATHAWEDTRVVFPPTSYTYAGGRRDPQPWPIASGKDVSWYKNTPRPYDYFSGAPGDFNGSYNTDQNNGTVHYGDRFESPGKKFWTWGTAPGGMIWEDLLTDTDGQYIEVQSGRLLTQGDSWIFEPLLVEEWTEWWYPLKNMGGFVKANPEAAVNLDIRDDQIQAALNTTGSVEGGLLRIFHENEVIFSEEVSLSPDKSYRRTIPHKKKPGDYILEWADSEDRPIIRYSTEKPDIPEPVLQPDSSSAKSPGAEIEYLKGYYSLKHWNTEAAIGFFKKTLSIDPDHINAMTQLGIQYYKTGRIEEALSLLNGVLCRQEDEYTALYYRALAQYSHGITDRTAEDLHMVGRRAAFRHVAPTLLAGLAMREGRTDEAAAFLSRALKTNPDDLKSMALLAALHRQRGDSAQAEQMVQKALDINPLALTPLFEQFLQTGQRPPSIRPDQQYDLEAALDYLDLSLIEDAARILESALSLHPDRPSPILLYHLYHLYESLGRKETAASFLKKALDCPPDYVFPFRLETEKVLKAALNSDPSDWKAHYYLGNLLVSKFRWEEGLTHYKQAASFSPPLAELYGCLGDISSRKQNDPLKAEEHYRRAVSLAPEQYRYYPILDELLFINGKTDERERLFREAPSDVKKNFTVLLQQAQFYVDEEQFDRALDILRTNSFLPWEGWTGAHEVFVRALLRKAETKFREGKYEDALGALEESLTYPENLGTGRPHQTRTIRERYLIGLCLHRLNRLQEAENEFKAATAEEAGMPSEEAYYQGKAFEALGRKEEAASLFQMLKNHCETALEQTQAAPLFHWAALACHGLGEHEKADRYLRQATRADPAYRGAVIFGRN
ncbi:MAG: DUF5107 domain-containing protein [Candidatus Aminicenantes bacterium]|nr:DUF5107 domain-containing protein [Candidatus Aminicenantes bacterium]